MTPAITVGLRVYTPSAKDKYGDAVESWSAPIDLAVYSVAPRSSDEPEEGRNAVVSGVSLHAPPGTPVGPLDRVVIDGVEYEVEGEIADWTRGPFGFASGVVIDLKRTEG